MKKQKSNLDSRFIVSSETELLNGIKKNNKTLEILDNMQELIESLCGTWSIESGKPMADNLIYKNKEGDEIDQYEFFDSIHHWIDKNQDYLLRDSKDKYNKIVNPKKRRAA